MTSSVSLAPRGRNFTRGLIAKAVVGSTPDAIATYSENRWGAQGLQVAKAAVASITTGDTGADAREFFGLVRERSILGRMAGLRRLPFNTRMLAFVQGTRGYWVGQAAPKPLSKPTLLGSSLSPLKVAAIVCVTEEAIESNDPQAEAALQADLERAVVDAMDGALLDPGNAGIPGEMPAAISNGAGTVTITASGDLNADLRAMFDAFQGDLSAAYLVTDPATAASLATATDAGGRYAFPGVGPRGGELLGIPLLTSRGMPVTTSGGTLTLIDPTGVAAALGALTVDRTEHATLAMSDDPDDIEQPIEQISLWQTDTIGFRAEVAANWVLQRVGGVVSLTGL